VSIAESSKKIWSEPVLSVYIIEVIQKLLPNTFLFVSEKPVPLATNVKKPQTMHTTRWRLQ